MQPLDSTAADKGGHQPVPGKASTRGRLAEATETELLRDVATCEVGQLHACLTELCYRRSCVGEGSLPPPTPALNALHAAWTTLGSDPVPLTPTAQLLLSISLDELKLCDRPTTPEQRLDFGALLSRVMSYLVSLIAEADTIEERGAVLQMIEEGVCDGCALLGVAVPLGTALSAEALLRVAEGLLPLAHVALSSPNWLRVCGAERFSACALSLRGALKDVFLPALCAPLGAGGPECEPHIYGPVAYACRQLCHTGRATAEAINSRGDAFPKELKNYGTLNATWVSIVKLLTAVPQVFRAAPAVVLALDVYSVVDTLLANLRHCMSDLLASPSKNQLTVTRFWIQHMTAVLGAYSGSAAVHLEPLLELHDQLQAALPPFRACAQDEQEKDVQHKLRENVLPRLASWISTAVLTGPDAPSANALLDTALPREQGASGSCDAALRVSLLCALAQSVQQQCPAELLLLLSQRLFPCMLSSSESLLPRPGGVKQLPSSLLVTLRDACLLFLSSCHAAEDGEAWRVANDALLQQAMRAHPIRLQLLSDILRCVFRAASPRLQGYYIGRLFEAASDCIRVDAVDCGDAMGAAAADQLARILGRVAPLCCSEVQARLHARLQEVCATAAHNPRDAALASIILGGSCSAQQFMQLTSQPARGMSPFSSWLQASRELLSSGRDEHRERHLAWLLLCLEAASRQSYPSLEQRTSCCSLACDVLCQGFKPSTSDDCLRLQLPSLQLLASNMEAYDGCEFERLALRMRGLVDASAGDVGAVAERCFGREPHLAPVFHMLLESDHWVARHAAMLALVNYSRSRQSGDFTRMIPAKDVVEGSTEVVTGQFAALMERYVRSHSAVVPESSLLGEAVLPLWLRLGQRLCERAARETAARQQQHAVSVSGLGEAVRAVERVYDELNRALGSGSGAIENHAEAEAAIRKIGATVNHALQRLHDSSCGPLRRG